MPAQFSAGTWHTSVVEATVRLRKEAENGASRALGSRAQVIHVGAHAAGSRPGMEALLQCRRLAVVPTLADPRAGQAKEASLPSSLGQLSSTGPICQTAGDTDRKPSHIWKLFISRAMVRLVALV